MNTYLIVSDINYRIKEKIKELTDGINNIVDFNMDESSMTEILEEASYYSMFDDKKCLIIKNANIFTLKDSNRVNDDTSKLLKYLDNENPNTLLIFIANGKVDSKKEVYVKLKEHNNVFTFNNMTRTDIKNELSKIVSNNKYKIDDNTLWYIINSTLGNLDLAINEINKIMLYYNNPCQIKYDDVVNLVSKSIVDNNFKLVDAIINKDLENSLKCLKDLEILKVEPSIILSLIYREFKLMLSTILFEKNNYEEREILKELNITNWQFEKIKSNLRRYNESKIKRIILNLAQKDYELKSGILSKDVVLIDFIIELCN